MIKLIIKPVYELGKLKEVHTTVKFLGITIYKKINKPVCSKEDDDEYTLI